MIVSVVSTKEHLQIRGLSIRKNAEMGQDQLSGGISVLY